MNKEELLEYVIDESGKNLRTKPRLHLSFSKQTLGGVTYLTPTSHDAEELLTNINATNWGNSGHPYQNRALWQVSDDLAAQGYDREEDDYTLSIRKG